MSPQLDDDSAAISKITARPARRRSAMPIVSGAKRRGLQEEGEERLDRISGLPDGVLGDIVSLLPTSDGARTQVLSSRWRHIWRSAPLNIDLSCGTKARFRTNREISRIISHVLSTHQGPVRRFSIPGHYLIYRPFPATNLDGWLLNPILDGLHELEIDYYCDRGLWKSAAPPLPASVHRFSSTLSVASFGGCSFPDGNDAGGLQFPVLKQLSLSDVIFSESSVHALLAACPVLQSLLLTGSMGCSRIRIASPTLRSIGVVDSNFGIILEQLIIEDAPSLERLLCFDPSYTYGKGITISLISAPRLLVLGLLTGHRPRLKFGTTVLQGSSFVSLDLRLRAVVHSVKVLSLTLEHLSLDVVIEFMKCFPCLEKLYIKIKLAREENLLCYRYKDHIGNLDIHLKKIVLEGYQGNMPHVNFAKFFVLNARMLESMRLQLFNAYPSNAWIDKQHRLLEIKNKASRDMQIDFASLVPSFSFFCPEKVHDLSMADPFS